jgi:uncharacterized membrane protein YedE/YeeE
MEGFTPFLSSIGGVLIGLAVVGLLLVNGRIAGILSGALIILQLHPGAIAVRIDVSNAAWHTQANLLKLHYGE